MKFGRVPIAEAVGAVLAHSLGAGAERLKKGRVLSAEDCRKLEAAGHREITVAQLDPDELGEDAAAARLARALLGPGLAVGAAATGRCNLYAEVRGLLVVDRERIDRLNGVDEAVTFATLPPFDLVEKGQIPATVKIITFGVTAAVIRRCEAIAAESQLVRVAPLRALRCALIQTSLPGLRADMPDKAIAVTRGRLAVLGSTLDHTHLCAHNETSVAAALKDALAAKVDLIFVLGASAIADRRDVIPAAVLAAGGAIEHFGMPVDPGNLMLLASIGRVHVLGLPGSARSPRLHGFDWVLQRLAAGVPVTGKDLMAMGVGGLLKEIPSRPMPRAEAAPRPVAETPQPRIAAIVLAAGLSRRMGKDNKMLVELAGKPLVRHVVAAALASKARPVVVVTGHQAEHVRAALAGTDVTFVHNPSYAEGLSLSLKAGIAAVPPACDGTLVCLGDMPDVSPALLDKLIAAFAPDKGAEICVPVTGGKRGNPILIGHRFFGALHAIEGDVGARHLIADNEASVIEVPAGDAAIFTDIDTQEALAAARKGRPITDRV
ncbi:MAG: NTP transferase domain-containing protein [Alphaproteobacteria bacterium]